MHEFDGPYINDWGAPREDRWGSVPKDFEPVTLEDLRDKMTKKNQEFVFQKLDVSGRAMLGGILNYYQNEVNWHIKCRCRQCSRFDCVYSKHGPESPVLGLRTSWHYKHWLGEFFKQITRYREQYAKIDRALTFNDIKLIYSDYISQPWMECEVEPPAAKCLILKEDEQNGN